MRVRIAAILSMIFFATGAVAQTTDHVVISEFATRGGSVGNQAGEFVEIYNPTDAEVDISGWQLQYQSASGSAYNMLARVPDNTTMRGKSFYLFTGASWGGTPEADAQWSSSGMADNGNIRITRSNGQPVDRVGYGSGNNPEGSTAPNHGTSSNDNSVERKASVGSTAASLAAGGAEETAGNGWDSNDNAADFVVQSSGRNPQNSTSAQEPLSADGSGTATTTLQQVDAAEEFDLPIAFNPLPDFPLQAMKIVIPQGFLWSGDESDVEIDQHLQAEISVSADTILFDRLAYSGDETVITLKALTAPSATGRYPFVILTTGGTNFLPIQNPPSVFVKGGPIPIAEARENNSNGVPVMLGETVTINGIVSVADQFGAPAYLQDQTGGIAVYDFNFTEAVEIGDEVTITGTITHFNGLTEIENITIDATPSTGNPVTPTVVTISQLLADGVGGNEVYESRLLRINGVTVNTSAWTVSGSGTNYKLSDGSAEIDVRVDNDVPFAGEPAPGGSFDIVGVLSQYKRDAPFVGGYQFMPRLSDDIIATGPRIVAGPDVTDLQPQEIAIQWKTAAEAEGFLRYGLTDAFELGTVESTESEGGTTNDVVVNGLDPATIYRVQGYSVAEGDTSFTQPMYVSTTSLNSTGVVNVYFNQSVDNSFPQLEQAQGKVNLQNKLMNRIDDAQHSIDICFYSLSGTPGDDIADRLLAAQTRGVKIRAIFETDNSGTNAIGLLRNNVPTIVDNFDKTNAGAGLMHNKFVIIDGRDRSSDTDDWVVMGSWNPTEPGSRNDAQNVVEIQDQALANAYMREFEEMWGSSTDTPASGTSRFGARKLDNTPHLFYIGQSPRIPMELYFSPSDHMTARLVETIGTAQHSLYFATLTFTRDDVARALADRHDDGLFVRGLMDNNSDQGNEFAYLQSRGVDVLLAKGLNGMLHHKYLLIDAELQGGDRDSRVVTGSHNWSNSAEFSNNENTLIIHDRSIAEQYLQEWYTRYKASGGTGEIVLSVGDINGHPAYFTISGTYPSPLSAARSTVLSMDLEMTRARALTLTLTDVLGRNWYTQSTGELLPGNHQLRIPVNAYPAGTYMLSISDGVQRATAKILIQR